jgi:formate dehydrogenase subunit gamma
MASHVVVEKPAPRVFITRFDIHQRVQHLVIIASFFVLAITGLPMKYSSWGFSAWWTGVWHGTDTLQVVHHYAAWVLIAGCAYHLLYVLIHRPFSTAILPKPHDLLDFIADMKSTFHLTKQPPQYDRYPYRNKAAYWIVYPGSIIMIVTGLLLLYPMQLTDPLPNWTLPLALLVHSDAAILAIGWILFVHMYFAHFSKHTIPFDKAAITGKVPAHRYAEEFPLEYARIMAANTVELPDDTEEGHGHAGHADPVRPQETVVAEDAPVEKQHSKE